MSLEVDTSLELWQKLYDCSIAVADKDVGHVRKRDAWLQVDFILDTLLANQEFAFQKGDES
jgi:hypothetical protein